MKYTFEGKLEGDAQDAGQAIEATVHSPLPRLFVRVNSWDPAGTHPEMRGLLSAGRVRVTVEAIDAAPAGLVDLEAKLLRDADLATIQEHLRLMAGAPRTPDSVLLEALCRRVAELAGG